MYINDTAVWLSFSVWEAVLKAVSFALEGCNLAADLSLSRSVVCPLSHSLSLAPSRFLSVSLAANCLPLSLSVSVSVSLSPLPSPRALLCSQRPNVFNQEHV